MVVDLRLGAIRRQFNIRLCTTLPLICDTTRCILTLRFLRCYHPPGPRWASRFGQIYAIPMTGRGESNESTGKIAAPCTYRRPVWRCTDRLYCVRKKRLSREMSYPTCWLRGRLEDLGSCLLFSVMSTAHAGSI